MMTEGCAHLKGLTAIKHPERLECVECMKTGDGWVHLRTCQSCGLTHCCDSSPNQHATQHARASSHPVIASGQPGERWAYCYPDDMFSEY
jgi:hypothetical protein